MISSAWVQSRLTSSKVPGAALAVVDDGELVWSGGFGLADPSRRVAVSASTVFQAASISKPVTALGILAMVDDGLLGLDDDVERIVGLRLRRHRLAGTVPSGSVTVRRLLQHRAGIVGRETTPASDGRAYRDGGGGSHRLPDRPGCPIPTLEDCWFGRRGSRPPVEVTYPPGSRVSYSGAGFLVLQRVVEVATGVSFRVWMRDRVLRPLGMADSTFAVRSARRRWSAVGHDVDGDALEWRRELLPWSAAGGLYSTVLDLTRVVSALGGADPEVVSPASVSTMRSAALGIFVREPGRTDEILIHGGSNSGFRSLLVAYPNRRAGIIVLTNGAAADGPQLRLDIARAVSERQALPLP